MMDLTDSAVYLARSEFQAELESELEGISSKMDDLIIAKAHQTPIFAQDIWRDPKIIRIDSIGDAVKKLKSIQAYWYAHPLSHARRTLLIEEQLPSTKRFQQHVFPLKKTPSLGVFTLTDKDTLLYSTERDKPIPNGEFNFTEDKINPPNRAYLKLWEALSLLNRYPSPGDFALDLGASPGGWTYVLHSCGASVLAIDKAPLAPAIAQLTGVEARSGSAFALTSDQFDHLDWMVGDIACYPERLYEWLQPWLASKKVEQFILTLKLQGETDFKILKKFQEIPNSRVLQLQHNKHEVTFFHPYSKNTPA